MCCWFPFDGQLQGGSHHILDMEGPNGMAAAMELHGLPVRALSNVRNDAIQLLAGSIHIGGAGEHHWKAIGLMEAVQV